MGVLRRVTEIGLLGLVVFANGGLTFGGEPALPSSRISAAHKQQYADLAVTWMQDYLRIDTTNPPGNEMKAISFFKRILDQDGIENRVFDYAPGRGDFWARLPHTTPEAKRPIVLLNHMDVVTSDPAHWKVPPFSGDIKDGYIWGRGAHDMPGHGSRPNPDSAPNRLVHALDKIIAYKTPLRVLPVVDEFLKDMAPYETPDRAAYYRDVNKAIQEKKFQDEVERDESLNFLLRDTISLTMLGGSQQTNVIPPDAWANLG